MAYSKFTLFTLRKKFGLSNKVTSLFGNAIAPITLSNKLLEDLATAEKLRPTSEKAKSELIIMPILLELMRRNDDFFRIYSGDNLSADSDSGLVGEIDFLLAYNTDSYDINMPLIAVVEAKKGEINPGIAQCAAQMLGVQIFNKKMETPVPVVYGCVTTANTWQFLKLENNQLWVDKEKFFYGNLPELLGVFQHIIDYYKTEIK